MQIQEFIRLFVMYHHTINTILVQSNIMQYNIILLLHLIVSKGLEKDWKNLSILTKTEGLIWLEIIKTLSNNFWDMWCKIMRTNHQKSKSTVCWVPLHKRVFKTSQQHTNAASERSICISAGIQIKPLAARLFAWFKIHISQAKTSSSSVSPISYSSFSCAESE